MLCLRECSQLNKGYLLYRKVGGVQEHLRVDEYGLVYPIILINVK